MPETTTQTLELSRTFDATPEELWDAWMDPAQYAKWLNPAPGHDLVIHEWDAREGGKVRFDMPQPDGNQNPQTGMFHTLEPHKRIVSGEEDRSFLLEATFTPVDERRTLLRVAITGIPPEYREPAIIGWNQCFDKLAEVLADEEGLLVITRTFDAPVAHVWEAWTDPERMKEWWGPEGFTCPVSRIDATVGGKYHHAMRDPDGKDYWSTGTYKELVPHERIVMTDSFADEQGNVVPSDHYGMPGLPEEMTVEVTFEEVDGKTRMTLRHHTGFSDREHKKGAKMGWSGSFDKMAAALAQRQGA